MIRCGQVKSATPRVLPNAGNAMRHTAVFSFAQGPNEKFDRALYVRFVSLPSNIQVCAAYSTFKGKSIMEPARAVANSHSSDKQLLSNHDKESSHSFTALISFNSNCSMEASSVDGLIVAGH